MGLRDKLHNPNSLLYSGQKDDPLWHGYLDDGKGWTLRPRSEYMKSPEYNKELRRQLREQEKQRKMLEKQQPAVYGVHPPSPPSPSPHQQQQYYHQPPVYAPTPTPHGNTADSEDGEDKHPSSAVKIFRALGGLGKVLGGVVQDSGHGHGEGHGDASGGHGAGDGGGSSGWFSGGGDGGGGGGVSGGDGGGGAAAA